MSHWRDKSTEAINRALFTLPNDPPPTKAQIEKALTDAYPFGVRQHHPYTIYLDEKKRILKKRFPHLYTNKEPDGPSLFVGE